MKDSIRLALHRVKLKYVTYNYLIKYIIDCHQFAYIKLNCLLDWINKSHLLISSFFISLFFIVLIPRI